MRAITAAILHRRWRRGDARACIHRAKVLARVGEKPRYVVHAAPRRKPRVTRIELRLMAWPLTKALREATVTARVLRAYA